MPCWGLLLVAEATGSLWLARQTEQKKTLQVIERAIVILDTCLLVRMTGLLYMLLHCNTSIKLFCESYNVRCRVVSFRFVSFLKMPNAGGRLEMTFSRFLSINSEFELFCE